MDFFKRLRADHHKHKQEANTRKHATALADAEFHRLMADHYTRLLTTIDHTSHWWEYADAKQKEQDNITMYLRYTAQAEQLGSRK